MQTWYIKYSFIDAVCPFMTNKTKLQRNIILKEEECISDVYEIFATLFSTNADSVGEPDEINMENDNVLCDVFEKHKNHNSILKIK